MHWLASMATVIFTCLLSSIAPAGLSLPADNEVEDPLKPLQSPAAEPGCNDWQLAFSPFSDRSRETATDSSHEGGCSMADSTAMGASAGKSSTGGAPPLSSMAVITPFQYQHPKAARLQPAG